MWDESGVGYSGSSVWCARALSRAEVDGVVPHIQHVILRMVGQPEEQLTAMRALNLLLLLYYSQA